MKLRFTMLLGTVLALTACQMESPAPSGDEVTSSVSISGSAFNPGTARTTVGQTVQFTNHDGVQHNVRWTSVPAGASNAGSPNLSQNATYDYTPAAGGTYSYACGIHSSMKGTLVVSGTAP